MPYLEYIADIRLETLNISKQYNAKPISVHGTTRLSRVN